MLGNDRVVIFANTPDPEYFDSIGTDSLSPAPVEEANKTPTGNKHWVPMSCLKKTRSFESRRHIAPRVRFSMPDSPSGTIKNKCSHKTSNPAWFLSNSDDASRILETSNSLPTTTAASESPSKVPVGRRSNYDIRSKQESHYCLEIEALRDQQQELRGKYNKLRVMLTSFKEGQITKSSSDGKRLHSMLTNQQNQHLICQNAVIFGASLIPHSLETPYCQHSTTFSNRKNYPRTTHTNGRSRVNPKKFNHESSINLRLLKLVKGL
ncbi:hypothetical protein WICPIJ_008592 [Wickerhamomyces pijperi]|uniref:Uncharacterized protein n=1 Tax=Wickerhamomyces pijperi TaxID=599730 RepID=A0A9P8PYE9_WICPI|nr:hypothetical protein WICPIJ_008592 [Wickerhamomyces pijperi]